MFLESAKKAGSIEIICGSMFSGKTEELIRRMKRAQFAKQRVEIYKPCIDIRYSEDQVVSHDSHSIPSTPIESPASMLLLSSQVVNVVDDYAIVSDEIVDGVRHVVATPSAKVCSRQIDIDLEGNVITKVVYTRGCDGNAKGIGALIKGMTVDEAIRRLEGINCGKRGTSCPDQLAKILKAIK